MIRIFFFGPDALPCDIGEQYLLKVYKTAQMVRLMKLELEKSPMDWLIANCRSTAIVTADDSVPKATKNYLSKIDEDVLLEYLLTKHGIKLGGVEEVRVYLLHSYMCHLGGVASGKLHTLASRCELKEDGELVIPPTLKPEIARAANALGKPVTHVEKTLKNIKAGNAKAAVTKRTGSIVQQTSGSWVSSHL